MPTYEESTTETITFTDTNDYLYLVDNVSETLTITDVSSRNITAIESNVDSVSITDISDNILMVDSVTDAIAITDIAEPDELIRKRVKFPNLQGKHLSLKFESTTDDVFAIYYLRHKMYKTRNLCSDQKHPNTQGNHIGLKLSNSGTDEFILMYSSQEHYMVDT